MFTTCQIHAELIICFFQAQNHARNAATAPNPAAAGLEHEHAAGHFAAAAKSTTNLEVPTFLFLAPLSP